MNAYLKAFLICLPLGLALDFVWIGFIAGGFYRANLGFIMSDTVVWPAAILFYVLYTAGVFFFVVRPAVDRGSYMQAGMHGILLGLLAYGTYDLTNLATLTNWPLMVTVVDMLWGAVFTAGLAKAGYLFVKAFSKKKA